MVMQMRHDLWGIVQEVAGAHGLRIGHDCEQLLRQMVASGEQKLLSEPHRADEAERNLREFVSTMASEARTLGLGELRERTFGFAQSRFCPGFWPFC